MGVIGVVIPNNEAYTGEIDFGENVNFFAIEIPDSFSGDTISFQSKALRAEQLDSPAEEDWNDVYDDAGTEVTVTVAGDRMVVIGTATKAAMRSLRYIRIRSGTAAAPVNQSPEREIKRVTKEG